MKRALKPGVYAPLPTFFDDHQELDYVSYKKHLLKLATKGMIPVCAGSLGEAVHLSFDERTALIRFIRATLDEAGLKLTPIVAGVGGLSTRETIALAKAASDAGADAGMVILPAYYAASLNTDANQVVQYYVDICEASPIPLLLYNFPANAGGQDMPSAVISEIMDRAPNLCGVKLTCGGSIGKLLRLNARIKESLSVNSSRPFPFLLLDGLIADLTPWMQCGGHGTVSGIPNFAPLASMRLWNLLNTSSLTKEKSEEASKLQAILSKADVAAVPGGIRAMKYALNKIHGYGVAPRRPLLPFNETDGDTFMETLRELFELEAELEKMENREK
ncbi:putative dihydrodipicolinate synthase [Talaromyces proteolyticus]|uniref:Dihydrodipicolinate synthase n=1 Tax=Talaromyces proteolyticus TaxID=1131652 RepID=A0AAD4KRA9_9EURO|nr:putative dihydrodipicolinate synthase [Talaromyces proteolyticus]KAH8698689.1 putative dihydrodipicolinate synthase [Talaromyces proteolyticus]